MQPIRQLIEPVFARQNPVSIVHAARTTVAALVSYLVARLFRLPESYWAAISTLVVMQSTLGAALPVSVQRFAGTFAGALVAGVTITCFGGNLWTFGAALFLIGLLCAIFRVERSAYRYAGITLAIIMLIKRSAGVWQIAAHRFFEVSLGIAVGLALSAVWPERPPRAIPPASGAA